MVVAGDPPRIEIRSVAQAAHFALGRDDADSRQLRLDDLLQLLLAARLDREQQLVIVAAGELLLQANPLVEQLAERRRTRQRIDFDEGAATARGAQLACIGEQAVRYVHRRARQSSQRPAELDARLRAQESSPQMLRRAAIVSRSTLDQAQAGRSLAE